MYKARLSSIPSYLHIYFKGLYLDNYETDANNFFATDRSCNDLQNPVFGSVRTRVVSELSTLKVRVT